MDELLTYTESGDDDPEDGSSLSKEVFKTGPVLFWPNQAEEAAPDEVQAPDGPESEHDEAAGQSVDTPEADDEAATRAEAGTNVAGGEESALSAQDLNDDSAEAPDAETGVEEPVHPAAHLDAPEDPPAALAVEELTVAEPEPTDRPEKVSGQGETEATRVSSSPVDGDDGSYEPGDDQEEDILDRLLNHYDRDDANPADPFDTPRETDTMKSGKSQSASNDDDYEVVEGLQLGVWAPKEVTEHDSSAVVVRALALGGGSLLALGALVVLGLPVLGVPGGTTIGGVPVSGEEDGGPAVQTLQQHVDQLAFQLTNSQGETVTKTGQELGLTVNAEETTKGLNSWINRSTVWIKRLGGPVTLPVVVDSTNREALAATGEAITLKITEPTVTLTTTGITSTPGADGYETDADMVLAALSDTVATVTSQGGVWTQAPMMVTTTGRTTHPVLTQKDVEGINTVWTHVLQTPVTLTGSPQEALINSPEGSGENQSPAQGQSASVQPSASGQPDASSQAVPSGQPSASGQPGTQDQSTVQPSPSSAAQSPGRTVVFSPGELTLVNHVQLAQESNASATPKPKESATATEESPQPRVGEEGEGESQAGEHEIKDEQTQSVRASKGDDVVLTPEDKLAITHVVVNKQAQEGQRFQLEAKTEDLPDSIRDFFVAHTVTKGLKAHVEGEQTPPAKASPTDKSLHDVSRVRGTVVVDSMENGFVPDEEGTITALLNAAQGSGGTITLQGLEDKVSSPESLGIKEPISTFTSFFTPGQGRVKNIHRIADLVDGVVVGPGQSFELNKHVGRRTRKNGFVEGGAIQEGQMVSEVGGGVSQFATTFFNAAWFSGVLIPQHKAHSQYFSRYPAGREATLNYPGVNLEIINDTPHAILIDTSHTASSVTVTFWSTKYWDVDSDRGKCLCVPHAAFPVTWTRTRTSPEGKSEKWTVTTYYQSPKPKKDADKKSAKKKN